MDMKSSKYRDLFDKAVLAFNRDIVINITTDIAGDLEDLKMPETVSTTDIVEAVKSKGETINRLKSSIKKELITYQGFIDNQNTKLETLGERIRILDEEKNEMLLKNTETRTLVKKMKERAKEEENKLLEMISKVQADIKEILAGIPDVQAAENKLAEAKEKLEAVERRQSHIEESAVRFFEKFFTVVGNHKKDVYAMLKRG